MIHIHRYTKWVTTGRYRDADFGTTGVTQQKECRKCGKVRTRYS
jgi:hypothetical protein